MKYLICVAFVFILGALGFAGFFMLRDGRDGKPGTHKMARALTVRIGLSVCVFALILLSYAMGWIQPTGIRVPR